MLRNSYSALIFRIGLALALGCLLLISVVNLLGGMGYFLVDGVTVYTYPEVLTVCKIAVIGSNIGIFGIIFAIILDKKREKC